MPGTALRRRNRLAPVWLALLLAGIAVTARAISVIPPTFDELVGEATEIVRVEVLGLSTQLDPSPHGPVIHTFVRCRVLRRLKGESTGGEVTVRMQGGQVGDLHMVVPGMPQFKAGERCVLFMEKNGTAFCPLVGVMHGCYRVARDPATGIEHVLRENREPLRATADVVQPLHETSGADASPARGLTVTAFEAAVTAKLREISLNARQR